MDDLSDKKERLTSWLHDLPGKIVRAVIASGSGKKALLTRNGAHSIRYLVGLGGCAASRTLRSACCAAGRSLLPTGFDVRWTYGSADAAARHISAYLGLGCEEGNENGRRGRARGLLDRLR